MNSDIGPIFEFEAGWGGQLWAWLSNHKLFMLVVLIIAALVIAGVIVRGLPDRSNLTAQTSLPAVASIPDGDTIVETVRPGDSYTTIARRALRTSGGRGLYAETVIAEKIRNQPLEVGFEIIIAQKLLDETLASFSFLSEHQRKRWEWLSTQLHHP